MRALTDDEFDAFLASRPGWMVLSTVGADGFPHSVPLGYFRHAESIYLGCRDNTQKTLNVDRNPRVALLVESGSTMSDIKGAMVQGTARVHRDAESVLRLMRRGAAARGVPEAQLPTEARPGSAFIEVQIERRISWDYGAETEGA
ncbi:MAG: pyridoxamine 5'-phosphate oxidase family protein [Pseudomonadota bacterium]